MQDAAPCHHPRIVSDWLWDWYAIVLDWPAYSPDLNPIENLRGSSLKWCTRMGVSLKMWTQFLRNLKSSGRLLRVSTS